MNLESLKANCVPNRPVPLAGHTDPVIHHWMQTALPATSKIDQKGFVVYLAHVLPSPVPSALRNDLSEEVYDMN